MVSSSRRRILIVEDEKSYARALVVKLQGAGFEVESAENGADALTALERSSFDLILSDVVMPKMTGLEMLDELRKRHSTVPVIILSNLSQANDEKRARTLDVADFFVKSNTPISAIIARVRELLGQT